MCYTYILNPAGSYSNGVENDPQDERSVADLIMDLGLGSHDGNK